MLEPSYQKLRDSCHVSSARIISKTWRAWDQLGEGMNRASSCGFSAEHIGRGGETPQELEWNWKTVHFAIRMGVRAQKSFFLARLLFFPSSNIHSCLGVLRTKLILPFIFVFLIEFPKNRLKWWVACRRGVVLGECFQEPDLYRSTKGKRAEGKAALKVIATNSLGNFAARMESQCWHKLGLWGWVTLCWLVIGHWQPVEALSYWDRCSWELFLSEWPSCVWSEADICSRWGGKCIGSDEEIEEALSYTVVPLVDLLRSVWFLE